MKHTIIWNCQCLFRMNVPHIDGDAERSDGEWHFCRKIGYVGDRASFRRNCLFPNIIRGAGTCSVNKRDSLCFEED
jgi:hypothetical protein